MCAGCTRLRRECGWRSRKEQPEALTRNTHVGDVAVSLRVPYERKSTEYQPPYDVLAELFELGQDGDGDEIDAEARGPLEDELVRRFVASPEAKASTARTRATEEWPRQHLSLGPMRESRY